MWLCGLRFCYILGGSFTIIFIDFYNDIHRKFITIGLPTDPLVEDRVLVKQRYWLEWSKWI